MTEALMDYMPHFSNPTVFGLTLLVLLCLMLGLSTWEWESMFASLWNCACDLRQAGLDDVPFAVADCREIETKETPESVATQV